MKIKHCGGDRKTVTYWLNPLEPKFKYTLLFIMECCPKCGQTVLEWQGMNHNNERTPLHRIAEKKHDEWRQRIKTDLANGERNHPGWSDATHEAKKDTAVVWPRTLQRYGEKAHTRKPVAV